MEWNTAACSIFSSPILCHTLVHSSIFLLEIGYFKDSIGILQFDFAGEKNAAGSPPAYFWDRAAKEEQKVPMVATVSCSDQSLIKHRRNVVGARVLWITVPYKSMCDCLDFHSSLKSFDFFSIVFSCCGSQMNLKMSNVALMHCQMILNSLTHG